MAEWTYIAVDKDNIDGRTVGHTSVMKVPGGMIVRTIVQDHGVAIVFAPDPSPQMTVNYENVLEKWIENNSI